MTITGFANRETAQQRSQQLRALGYDTEIHNDDRTVGGPYRIVARYNPEPGQ